MAASYPKITVGPSKRGDELRGYEAKAAVGGQDLHAFGFDPANAVFELQHDINRARRSSK